MSEEDLKKLYEVRKILYTFLDPMKIENAEARIIISAMIPDLILALVKLNWDASFEVSVKIQNEIVKKLLELNGG